MYERSVIYRVRMCIIYWRLSTDKNLLTTILIRCLSLQKLKKKKKGEKIRKKKNFIFPAAIEGETRESDLSSSVDVDGAMQARSNGRNRNL